MSSTAGQVIKCKAAVAWEAGKPLVIEEIEVAPPQVNEVRVKILFTSLCHTDVYFWEAKYCGECRRGCNSSPRGDHVLPIFTGECGECPTASQRKATCVTSLGLILTGVLCLVMARRDSPKMDSPFTTFLAPPHLANTLYSFWLPRQDQPCSPTRQSLHYQLRTIHRSWCHFECCKTQEGSICSGLWFGCCGLAAAEGARIAGASRIIGVDMNSSRFEQAKKFGCTEFVNPKDHDKPVQEVIAEMTDGGVDRALECTGSVQAMISAFECVHDGWGVAVLVGVPNKDDEFRTHPFKVLSERTLKGTFFGNYKPRTDIPGVVEQYMNKELEVEKFITHSVPFSEINTAFDLMLTGKSLRCIIRLHE
ncbi:Alcohol dehydrogenase 1 [Morella rubra]|uniref:Alcohol dehydrogenase 1 n=1 Tax=Morella rubra TaxID=262757 RepID=A0A6A1W6K8_9ROSI|nr:Alcohol dehydrogenase 1 [Morella rubra]